MKILKSAFKLSNLLLVRPLAIQVAMVIRTISLLKGSSDSQGVEQAVAVECKAVELDFQAVATICHGEDICSEA